MNIDKILVAYSSRYGSTHEIAECIAEQLRELQDGRVDLCEAGQVQDLPSYRAVVLGSAIYEGHWLDSARHLLTDHEDQLQGKDLWLFSSGPVQEGSPAALLGGWKLPENLEPVATRLRPHDIKVFSGKFDADRVNLDDWCLQREMRLEHADYRDWTAIGAWACEIAQTLMATAN